MSYLFYEIFFIILIAFVTILIRNILVSGNVITKDYSPISKLNSNNGVFNIVSAIFIPNIIILVIISILNILSKDFLFIYPDLYLKIILFYWLISLFWTYVVLERQVIVAIKPFIITICFSLILALYFNSEILPLIIDRNFKTLIPSYSEIKAELWFLIIAFAMFNISNWIDKDSEKNKWDYIYKKSRQISKQYKQILKDLDNNLKLLLISHLIYENYNRPHIIRKIERYPIIKKYIKTTGISQVIGSVSDEQSIIVRKQQLLKFSKIGLQEYEILQRINGEEYAFEVYKIYNYLKEKSSV